MGENKKDKLGPLNIGVFGANGRMGKALIDVVDNDIGCSLSAALVREGNPLIGAQVFLEDQEKSPLYRADMVKGFEKTDVFVDFTLPEALEKHLEYAKIYETPLVIGTTGLSAVQLQGIKDLANHIPIVYDTNMSLGITILNTFVEKMARILEAQDFDIDISEMHHSLKKDIPSGTAMTLALHAAKGRGVDLDNVGTNRFDGTALQCNHIFKTGEIGLSAKRGGGVFGDHEVIFTSEEEMIKLSHRALSRSVFAKGALRAAKWVFNQPPGLYSMKEVLGIYS